MRGRYLIGLLLASVLFSCEKVVEQRECYPVRVLLETSSATKADAAEGDVITDILLIFVQNGKLASEPVYKVLTTASSSEEVSCGVMEVGTYSLYAYANTGHDGWLDSGVQIQEKGLHKGDDFPGDRLLKTLSGQETPAKPASAMLLTGESAMNVDIVDNLGVVRLTRPVLRFNVLVSNHANVAVTLSSLSFSAFNPSVGYLLPHSSLPSGLVYNSLPGFGSAVSINQDEEKIVYSTLLYEGAADSYNLSASFTMTDPSSNSLLERHLDNVAFVMVDPETSLPVPLTSMKRNQDLTVVVNVYYQELEGSFTLSVDNIYWSNGHTSSHTFE